MRNAEQRQYRKAIALLRQRLGRQTAGLLFRAACNPALQEFLGQHYDRLVNLAKKVLADHATYSVAFQKTVWELFE